MSLTRELQISAVGEHDAGWLRKIANLAISLQLADGCWGERSLDAYIVNGNDRHSALRAVGASTRAVPPVLPRSPLNKLRMFAAADPARTLVALDCDVLVAEELVTWSEDVVAGAPAEYTLVPAAHWRRLFEDLRLPLLAEPLISTVSGEMIPVPYLNSGVVVMPGRWAAELADAWLHYAEVVREHPALTPWSDALEFHREQVALTCALSALGLPLRVLPVEYNVPFRSRDVTRVRALHYHRQISAVGLINRPPARAGHRVVDRVNNFLRSSGLTGVDWPGG